MYRCACCRAVSKPKQPQLRYAVKRPNGQTETEIPVCPDCAAKLARGEALAALIARHAPPPASTENDELERPEPKRVSWD